MKTAQRDAKKQTPEQMTMFGDWVRVSIVGANYPRPAHTVRAGDAHRTCCGAVPGEGRTFEPAKSTEHECRSCVRLRTRTSSRGAWMEGLAKATP